MQKNRGFTLIELLGVLTLLAVIALIAVLAINKNIKDGKQKMYEKQLEMIELAAKNWGSDHLEALPRSENEMSVSLMTLKIGGYIDKDISNPANGKCFANTTEVKIKNKGKSYSYYVDEATVKFDELCDIYDVNNGSGESEVVPAISVTVLDTVVEHEMSFSAFLVTSNIACIDSEFITLEHNYLEYLGDGAGFADYYNNHSNLELGSVSCKQNLDGSYDSYFWVMPGIIYEDIYLKIAEGALVSTNGTKSEEVISDNITIERKKPEIYVWLSEEEVYLGENTMVGFIASDTPIKDESKIIINDLNVADSLYLSDNDGCGMEYCYTINVYVKSIGAIGFTIEEGAFVKSYGGMEKKNNKISTDSIYASHYRPQQAHIYCDNRCVDSEKCADAEIKKGIFCQVKEFFNIYTGEYSEPVGYYVLFDDGNKIGLIRETNVVDRFDFDIYAESFSSAAPPAEAISELNSYYMNDDVSGNYVTWEPFSFDVYIYEDLSRYVSRVDEGYDEVWGAFHSTSNIITYAPLYARLPRASELHKTFPGLELMGVEPICPNDIKNSSQEFFLSGYGYASYCTDPEMIELGVCTGRREDNIHFSNLRLYDLNYVSLGLRPVIEVPRSNVSFSNS